MHVLKTKHSANLPDAPMFIKAVLHHKYAKEFMNALVEEIKSIKDEKSLEYYFGNLANIPKTSLLSSNNFRYRI
jgi:hypothetical protein